MGTKYGSGVTISGYNASPPPDDASQVAANQVTWARIKTKLPDPLKTAIESMNSSLVTALDMGSRQISSNDTTTAADHLKTIEIAPSTTVAVTVSLGDAATMAAGYIVSVKNSSAIAQTVGRATAGDKIDNVAANVTLAPKEARTFKVANTASEGYLTIDSFGPFTDQLIAETAPAVSDTVSIFDASASANRKMALSDFMKIVGSLVAEAAPAVSDSLLLYDDSAGTADRVFLADFFRVINGLTEDTSPDPAADYLVTYDASGNASKKVLLGQASVTIATEQTPTSSSVTSVDFTSIPAYARTIFVMFESFSTNGPSAPLIQLGDSGGIEATDYTAAGDTTDYTTGFPTDAAAAGAGASRNGFLILQLMNASTNTWLCGGITQRASATVRVAGIKSLSATLDRIRFTTVAGTDQFDGGSSFNVAWMG